jgi:hypothetical protein
MEGMRKIWISQVKITTLQAMIWAPDFHNMKHRNTNQLTAKFSLLHNEISNDIYRRWPCTYEAVFLTSFNSRCTVLNMCNVSPWFCQHGRIKKKCLKSSYRQAPGSAKCEDCKYGKILYLRNWDTLRKPATACPREFKWNHCALRDKNFRTVLHNSPIVVQTHHFLNKFQIGSLLQLLYTTGSHNSQIPISYQPPQDFQISGLYWRFWIWRLLCYSIIEWIIFFT